MPRAICCQPVDGSLICCKHSRPPSNLVNGQELTMCDIVWISPHSHSSLSLKPNFLWHALQWPWPVRKRFSSDHWRWWRSKPGSRIVGSTTKVELTTVADCQSSLHRLVTSIYCKSLHIKKRKHNGMQSFRNHSISFCPVSVSCSVLPSEIVMQNTFNVILWT